MEKNQIREFLEKKVKIYNTHSFMKNDPISIPHMFKNKQDIEISGFFAANFAWGRRDIIIKKTKELLSLMDFAPYDFILNHNEKDLLKMTNFKHRTFNGIDLIYFLTILKKIYINYSSLEDLFVDEMSPSIDIKNCIINFHKYFFHLPHLKRTEKHISNPLKHSACKKINMFLRWMVRNDKYGVDFGIWKKINSASLIIPCDVHVLRTSTMLGLISTDKPTWQTALNLTALLKEFCPEDPIKYDFALLGIGIENIK